MFYFIIQDIETRNKNINDSLTQKFRLTIYNEIKEVIIFNNIVII